MTSKELEVDSEDLNSDRVKTVEHDEKYFKSKFPDQGPGIQSVVERASAMAHHFTDQAAFQFTSDVGKRQMVYDVANEFINLFQGTDIFTKEYGNKMYGNLEKMSSIYTYGSEGGVQDKFREYAEYKLRELQS